MMKHNAMKIIPRTTKKLDLPERPRKKNRIPSISEVIAIINGMIGMSITGMRSPDFKPKYKMAMIAMAPMI